MKANELRELYINFFVERGHKRIPSASLIPENDPSVLFTTAGMHPLVPYLLGERHPLGKRLTDCQKCLRTGDIDEVGDARHLTFFEMMGNWSLGDYFKDESIAMSSEFLLEHLRIPQDRLSVSVFAGDDSAPRDETSAGIWKSLGYPAERIHYYGKDDNWWGPAGVTGPCGPDTEIFYDTGKPACGDDCQPSCGCGKYVEIWNNVFMEYFKDEQGTYTPLPVKNVDTGLGLERVLCVINGAESVFDTELFMPVTGRIEQLASSPLSAETAADYRIAADHLRASVFILGDDKAVSPSNVDQGYILRRLIRRALRRLSRLGAPAGSCVEIASVIIREYSEAYPELERNSAFILSSLAKEEEMFGRTLEQGLKIAGKYLDRAAASGRLSAKDAFDLYSTYGFPLELTDELARERGMSVDSDGFSGLFEEHQKKSSEGATQRFAGGLADHSELTARLHTATHLLHAALRGVLGPAVFQRGSNITPERLRFDFSFERKLTDDELVRVAALVNEAISAGVDVTCDEMSADEARQGGAIGLFDDKYGERVKVYTIAGFSCEICGGPHASNTAELGTFRILQETSSSAGVRRIKAVLEQAD